MVKSNFNNFKIYICIRIQEASRFKYFYSKYSTFQRCCYPEDDLKYTYHADIRDQFEDLDAKASRFFFISGELVSN